MAKTLWIVSGGMEAVPGIERAKALGCRVVVSDGSPHAPGFAVADDRVVCSTYDVEATAAAARDYRAKHGRIDGVMAMAADVPRTIAGVAQALSLPGISTETAALASDKLAMKNHFVAAGIPVPWFSPVESLDHLRRIVAERGFPIVIKPVDSRGARGVLKLRASDDLAWAYEHSKSVSPTGRVMAEEYLAGPQISTESVLLDEISATPGFIDRNYEHLERFAPYMIENGGEQPSILGAEDRQRVVAVAERAARALGITRGTAKGDLILTPDGPKVVEIAARLSGGWMSTDQIQLGTGVDMIGVAIRIALGESIGADEIRPKFERGVAIRYLFPKPGRIVCVDGVEAMAKMPGVHRHGVSAKVGEQVPAVTDHTKRAGFVLTAGETRDEAVRRASDAIDGIVVETV